MPRLLLFYIFLFCAIKSWSVDYQRTVNWFPEVQNADLKGALAPEFDGSIILDQTRLPYWLESFELDAPGAEVSISNAVFEPLLHPYSGLIDYQESELQYKSEIGVSAGRSILRLTIFPFIRRNNQIEKLVGFTVSIKENRNQLKSAGIAYPWKSNSVLASGKWIKIKTKSKGIYKITFDQIKQWGFTNPDQVTLFGNGGLMLPVLNRDIRFDDLNAYPAWKGKDNAGKDCLFFYSSGNIRLIQNLETGTYTHKQNYYSTETYFYLSDQGVLKTINKIPELNETAGKKVSSFLNYTFYEKESLNLIASGSQWFGEKFMMGGSQTINLPVLDNPDLTQPARYAISVAARSSKSSSMDVVLNGKTLKDIVFQSVNVSDPTTYYADDQIVEFPETLPSKNIQVKITYQADNSSSEAWLDYISVNYQSLLNMNSDVYFFRGRGVDGQIPVSEFDVNGATPETKVFDVTDITNTIEMPVNFADGQIKFKSNSGTTREYVAFNPVGTIPSPEWVGTIANQDLHASDMAEMIIVTNSNLLKAAEALAKFHRDNDQMTVQVITPELIYNEFSGGLPDPAAFRNYFRMRYELGKQSGKNTLKYILLMGDGSYDNRNIKGKNLNLIPTFQSDNSLSPTGSFVTDDFFVFLDENEGGFSGIIDLGIGRIPAKTAAEADLVVEKINNYNQKQALGNWRNVVTFIGDDEDNNIHMAQSDYLADFITNNYPAFFTEKIYLDAYKQISTPGGEKYPDVTEAITNRVKFGTLVMNYTGHANAKNMAAENVLDIGIINTWTNFNRLPIFVTATCEFSRFDDDESSGGEHFLFNPNGGGVGLFSTTRVVYSDKNFNLSKEFFKYVFKKDPQGNNLRLGDVMLLAKASANTGINQLNFSLLADPAMRLANPNYQVKTTSIDGENAETVVDTIRTLSLVTVKGFVADNSGAKLTSFNGEIIPIVYDKAMQVETLGNKGEEPFKYSIQNNVIYKGLASVKNGDFEFSFFVPKDISFKLGKGKIIYYAYNESTDALGYYDGFYVGGASTTTIADSNGPDIEMFLNSDEFKDGGLVSASSVLIANIKDDNGINTAGIGIGHDITAVLDGDYSNLMVLNEFFQTDKDNYKTGKIVFPLTKLSEGEHVLKIKVWDVFNNSSEKEIRFVVKDVFRIETVACYPNPMQGETRFTFTHNQPDETFKVSLEVFQTSGARIDQVKANVGSQATESLPLKWVPAERLVKMSPGVYIYKLTVTTNDGKMSSGSGRLVYVYR